MLTFLLNQQKIETDQHPGTVLLDFVRRDNRLFGTKEGCREGDCGACTVLVGQLDGEKLTYRAVNSCLLPIGSLQGKHIVTLEGLNGTENTALQDAFIFEHASQCGFCTPGFIVSLTDFLLNNADLKFEEAIATVSGNICRCTGYASIRRAIDRFIIEIKNKIDLRPGIRIEQLIKANQLPAYFADMPARLTQLTNRAPKARNGKIVGGGTDLFVQQADALREASLQFVDETPGSHQIKIDNDACIIAAATTMEDMRRSPIIQNIIPDFDPFAKLIASKPIRERATLAGNIVNASPIADFTIILLALGASLELEKNGTGRIVALHDFYLGYKQLDLQPEEKIVSIRFPVPPGDYAFHFEKVSRRTHLDIASVNSAAFIANESSTITLARLSAGGVAPVPFLLQETNAFLTGSTINDTVVRQAMDIAAAEISPISDVRGSADYKRTLLRQLLFAHFHAKFPQYLSTEVA
ncbi:MAG: FAD binding domain-containing protein [Deferribacteres bacterium]|nr:FAD binding domain-containing protein [candidate division KSB1 bacterium]MCB9500462.1 FAD binding domain-containing protein [Deferribacteres bacterium]